jgi:hypothetical protein
MVQAFFYNLIKKISFAEGIYLTGLQTDFLHSLKGWRTFWYTWFKQ